MSISVYKWGVSKRSAAAFCVALIALIAGPLFAGPAQFDEGNAKFAAGDFAAAKKSYEAAVQAGNLSANLFYNLGNAEFRLGNEGRAILQYERALALDPEHPEARANLSYARNKTGAKVEEPSLILNAAHLLPSAAWVWMAVILGWIGLFSLVARLMLWRSGRVTFVASTALVVCACAIGALWIQRGDYKVAIVLNETAARLAPAESASEAARLPAGSRVRILQQDYGPWTYCLMPDHSRVWLSSADLERISAS